MEQTDQESTPTTRQTAGLRWGRIFAWIAVIGILIILAVGLLRSQQGSVNVGQKIPDFALTTFDGQNIRSADLRGKVLVINFWASWCKPCEQEAADLEAAWRFYQGRGDVVFLGVNYVDTEPEARAYLQKFEITYPNGPDLGTRISQAFRIRGVPETYIVDQQGILQFVQIGPFRSLTQIKAVIDPLLQP
ncbi:MAG: Thiol:disulfide oxidoreductase related to ResA [Anaerolineae bacterium]|nr:MAG: Thiol:disulfide oxidoreductase related to ResA [Anaerolineae bacterium]